jgi:hypothetical protein
MAGSHHFPDAQAFPKCRVWPQQIPPFRHRQHPSRSFLKCRVARYGAPAPPARDRCQIYGFAPVASTSAIVRRDSDPRISAVPGVPEVSNISIAPRPESPRTQGPTASRVALPWPVDTSGTLIHISTGRLSTLRERHSTHRGRRLDPSGTRDSIFRERFLDTSGTGACESHRTAWGFLSWKIPLTSSNRFK